MHFTIYTYTRCTDPEREEEYNSWYTYTHIPELSQAKGLQSAKRYVNLDMNNRARYLTVYNFDTDSVRESLRSIFALVRKAFETGTHIDCYEVVNTVNVPFVSCFKEIEESKIKKLQAKEYPRNMPVGIDDVGESIERFY